MFEQLKEKILAAKADNWQGGTLNFQDGILMKNVVVGHVFLGASLDEMPSRIAANDPLRVSFFIESKGDGLYTVEPSMSIGRLKPENPMYAMDSVKVRTRKFTGDDDKVAKNIGNMLDKLRKRIEELDNQDRFLPLPYSIPAKVYK